MQSISFSKPIFPLFLMSHNLLWIWDFQHISVWSNHLSCAQLATRVVIMLHRTAQIQKPIWSLPGMRSYEKKFWMLLGLSGIPSKGKSYLVYIPLSTEGNLEYFFLSLIPHAFLRPFTSTTWAGFIVMLSNCIPLSGWCPEVCPITPGGAGELWCWNSNQRFGYSCIEGKLPYLLFSLSPAPIHHF